jgi:hypothetical protein
VSLPERALAPPDRREWDRRAAWFWKAHDVNAGPAALRLDARGELLLGELESAFCAGAWAAATMIAWALVEREERNRAQRGDALPAAPEIDWLRAQRNALAHGEEPIPDDAALRCIAEGAVRTVFRTLFAGAWR